MSVAAKQHQMRQQSCGRSVGVGSVHLQQSNGSTERRSVLQYRTEADLARALSCSCSLSEEGPSEEQLLIGDEEGRGVFQRDRQHSKPKGCFHCKDWVLSEGQGGTGPLARYSSLPVSEEVKRLTMLRSLLILDTASESNFNKITASLTPKYDVSWTCISLVDIGRQWFKSVHSNTSPPKKALDLADLLHNTNGTSSVRALGTSRCDAFCAHTILQQEATPVEIGNSGGAAEYRDGVFIVRDSLQDDRFRTNPLVLNAPNLRFYAGAPLLTPPDGEGKRYKVGALAVLDSVPRYDLFVNKEQRQELCDVADQVIQLMMARKEKKEKAMSVIRSRLKRTASDINQSSSSLSSACHATASTPSVTAATSSSSVAGNMALTRSNVCNAIDLALKEADCVLPAEMVSDKLGADAAASFGTASSGVTVSTTLQQHESNRVIKGFSSPRLYRNDKKTRLTPVASCPSFPSLMQGPLSSPLVDPVKGASGIPAPQGSVDPSFTLPLSNQSKSVKNAGGPLPAIDMPSLGVHRSSSDGKTPSLTEDSMKMPPPASLTASPAEAPGVRAVAAPPVHAASSSLPPVSVLPSAQTHPGGANPFIGNGNLDDIAHRGANGDRACDATRTEEGPQGDEDDHQAPPLQQKDELLPAPGAAAGRSASNTLESIILNPREDNLPDPKALRGVDPDKYLLQLVEAMYGVKLRLRPAFDLDSFFAPVTEEQMSSYSMEVVSITRENKVDDLRMFYEVRGRAGLDCYNRFGEGLLNLACRRGFEDIVKFLLSDDIALPVRVRDDCGRTPLHDACWNPSPQLNICTWIIGLDPSLFLITDKRGYTPFQYARKSDWRTWRQFLYDQRNHLGKLLRRGVLEKFSAKSNESSSAASAPRQMTSTL